LAAGAGVGTLVTRPEEAAAGTNPYLGEIMLFAGATPPSGWALCNGQLLSIAQNMALFQLIGTTYGGNGTTTFALPDLRGRAPIHAGQGPGLSNRVLGDSGGEESHQLTVPEMPAHSHAARARSGNGTSAIPTGLVPARDPSGTPHYGASPDVTLAAGAIGTAGGGQPHNNMQPYLVITYCIALTGAAPTP
jgi:microcystin-dependent protein